jgi:hypothetical protein
MSNPDRPTRPRPPVEGSGREHSSINDNLPSSSPSGNTVLKVIACVLGFVVLSVLYAKTIGF